jgi:uncharacterized paraquat-inducible protein A
VKALYCSSCGVAVTQSLSYCNRCGVKLSQSEPASKSSNVKPEVLVSSMVATFILGLFGITALMGVLKVILQLQTGQILGVATFGFLMMLLLEGVFITLLFRRRRDNENADEVAQLPRATKELDAVQPQNLPEGVASVTEHTTRAFEPIYRERAPK